MERKQIVQHFLQLVTEGKIDEAYERYVTTEGKHHNPLFMAGFSALRAAMKENHKLFPNKQYIVKHALADGDLVALHAQLIQEPGGKELALMHLFRFKGDKIVEMWDCSQEIPVDMPNKDGAF